MPNWCSTSLEIETGTERLAKKVSDKIESWCHECGVENGFGDNWLGNIAVNSNAFPKYSDVSCRGTLGLAGFTIWHAVVPTSIKLLSEDSEVAESHSLASLKTGSHLDGKAALSFGYLTEQDEYVVMMRQDDGGYRRKSYPADGTVVYEDAEADDARVEVVDQYVVIRETHEFPIVGEWTRDRREFLKCEIRIHVPAGSIAQGEYDIT